MGGNWPDGRPHDGKSWRTEPTLVRLVGHDRGQTEGVPKRQGSRIAIPAVHIAAATHHILDAAVLHQHRGVPHDTGAVQGQHVHVGDGDGTGGKPVRTACQGSHCQSRHERRVSERIPPSTYSGSAHPTSRAWR